MKTAIADIDFQKEQFEKCLHLFNPQWLYRQERFESLLAEYNLNRNFEVHSESLIIKSGSQVVISTTLDMSALFQPCLRSTKNLDQFKAWIGIPNSLFEQGVFSFTKELPSKPWMSKAVSDISSLSLAEQEDIERAGYAYLFGNSKLVDSYKEVLEKLHAPFEVAVCAIKKVVIESGGSLIIQGSRPAVLIFGELEIIEGSTIKIYAPTNMTVQQLHKISN
ncbi:hypothetical protein BLD44_017600 [Mastigocladus laminosus UU774]|nr:hypothetical protein BLD44_017600 [Mastigocladus laminosus UU774]